MDSSTAMLALAHESLSMGRWVDARREFEQALTKSESPEAMEGLGAAAWWQEDVPTVLRARERAYRLYRSLDDRVGAGRMATELGFDYAVFRLEMAVSSGWLQRAHRLLDDLDPVAEQVWLAFREAELAYHTAGDMEQSRRLAVGARKLAHDIGLLDLEMVGLALEGLTLVGQGDVPDGMRRLDEATAAAVAGDMQDLKAIAATCCFMVFSCERVRDVDRASQWCDQFLDLYRRRDMRAYLAFCGAHHASVQMARGRWDEADDQLTTSRQVLRSHAAWAMTVFERLGELRRRQGRLDEAADNFERATPNPGGILGIARVACDRGAFDVALDLAEGVLRGTPERDRVERIAALELLVRARCAQGDTEGVEEAVTELENVAHSVGTDALSAAAQHARAQLSLASDDAASANHHDQDALDGYERARLPYEAALVRMHRARALQELGRADAAVEQARRARDTLRELGAAVATERADALLHDLLGTAAPPPGGGLSPREADVLRLLSRGLSNQQIADELVLSRHTVRRHISNILTKLGVSSRTAAATYAHEHGLV